MNYTRSPDRWRSCSGRTANAPVPSRRPGRGRWRPWSASSPRSRSSPPDVLPSRDVKDILRSMSFTSEPASRWGDVYLATGARAVSVCGDFLAATALVLALQQRGAGSVAIAAILIAAAVPPVVLAPWTGRLADRV